MLEVTVPDLSKPNIMGILLCAVGKAWDKANNRLSVDGCKALIDTFPPEVRHIILKLPFGSVPVSGYMFPATTREHGINALAEVVGYAASKGIGCLLYDYCPWIMLAVDTEPSQRGRINDLLDLGFVAVIYDKAGRARSNATIDLMRFAAERYATNPVPGAAKSTLAPFTLVGTEPIASDAADFGYKEIDLGEEPPLVDGMGLPMIYVLNTAFPSSPKDAGADPVAWARSVLAPRRSIAVGPGFFRKGGTIAALRA